jgi:hypothetical protein
MRTDTDDGVFRHSLERLIESASQSVFCSRCYPGDCVVYDIGIVVSAERSSSL